MNTVPLMSRRSVVVTTINPPSSAMRLLAQGAKKNGVPLIIIGDTKTPDDFYLDGAQFVSIYEQEKRYPDFARILPVKHYARKNIGYLIAIEDGCREIQETDDDNFPRTEFWCDFPSKFIVETIPRNEMCAWFNVYGMFSDADVWPRGFPLEFLSRSASQKRESISAMSSGLILQGLADRNPDVDAIYRLTKQLPINFEVKKPVMLSPGVWCPFNSQNTIFRNASFPLLYLPSNCSFRMTDIWRSFVAQRCLWELGEGVVFHSATVYQERNEHNLLKDFEDEVPGYLLNDRIRHILEGCSLDRGDLPGAMAICYEALVKNDIFPREEVQLVYSWCRAVEQVMN